MTPFWVCCLVFNYDLSSAENTPTHEADGGGGCMTLPATVRRERKENTASVLAQGQMPACLAGCPRISGFPVDDASHT